MCDCIAPNSQHLELNRPVDTECGCGYNTERVENYDLSDDLGISSSIDIFERNNSFDEMPDEVYREAVRSLVVF